MSEEQQKKDAMADALSALAAGQHPEEPPAGSGSGISGHAQLDHVSFDAAPTPPATPAPVPLPLPTPRPAPRTPATPRRSANTPPPGAANRAAKPPQAIPPRQADSSARPNPPAANPPGSRPNPASPAAAMRPSPAPAKPSPAARPAAQTTPPPAARPAPPAAPRVAGAPIRPSSPHSKPRPQTPGRLPGGTAAPPPPPRPVPAAPPEPPAPPPPPAAEPFVVYDDVAPSEHHLSDHDREVAAEADAIAHVVEDDDTLNLPAPPPEAFAPRPPKPRPPREHISRTVGFKQTLIPILLTQGVLLPAIGAYLLSLGDESPLVGHTWIPLSLLAIGAVLLLFAALTMLQVRSELARAVPA